MNTIHIKIAAGLTPAEELAAITKLLRQKQLSGAATNQDLKFIGNSIQIEHLQTQILITRESKEPLITMKTCNCCGQEYQSNTAVPYWHNYGGKVKKVDTCSNDCAEAVVTFLGNRAALKKSSLRAVRTY